MEDTMKEFKVGDVVTVDKYNHIDDIQKGIIVGYARMPISNRLTYKIKLSEITIQSSGISIMESKFYEPVAENERHSKIFKRQNGEVNY